MKISFNIPDAKAQRVKDAILGLYPNTEGITEEHPTPTLTDNQWVKEVIRRWIIDQVARNEQKEAQKIIIQKDDSLIN